MPSHYLNVWCQAITWINDDLLSIGPLQTNSTEIWIKIQYFSLKKMYLIMLSLKWTDGKDPLIDINYKSRHNRTEPGHDWSQCRPDFRLAPSQWEMSLQSNAISHWLGANLESDLQCWHTSRPFCHLYHVLITMGYWALWYLIYRIQEPVSWMEWSAKCQPVSSLWHAREHIQRLWCQKQVTQAGICSCIP